MLSLASSLDLPKLLNALDDLPYVKEGNYIEMASVQSQRFLGSRPLIRYAIEELESLRKLDCVYIMVNVLPSGAEVPWHQDFLEPTPLQPYKHPLIERWHLPVLTNTATKFETKTFPYDDEYMKKGFWWGPVPYWKHHRVVNYGDTRRVHLIVDLDCPEPCGAYEK